MTGYVLTPLAERDLLEIGRYIATDSVTRAGRVIETLRKAMTVLAAQPLIGHERLDLAPQPYRFWPVYSYLIAKSSRHHACADYPCPSRRSRRGQPFGGLTRRQAQVSVRFGRKAEYSERWSSGAQHVPRHLRHL